MKTEDNLGLGPSTDLDEEMSDIEQVAGWLYRNGMTNASRVVRGEVDARNVRIDELSRNNKALDRIVAAQDRNAMKRINAANSRIYELVDETARYKSALQKIDRGASAYLSSNYLGDIARKALKEPTK